MHFTSASKIKLAIYLRNNGLTMYLVCFYDDQDKFPSINCNIYFINSFSS